jgi:hypothetical protein
MYLIGFSRCVHFVCCHHHYRHHYHPLFGIVVMLIVNNAKGLKRSYRSNASFSSSAVSSLGRRVSPSNNSPIDRRESTRVKGKRRRETRQDKTRQDTGISFAAFCSYYSSNYPTIKRQITLGKKKEIMLDEIRRGQKKQLITFVSIRRTASQRRICLEQTTCIKPLLGLYVGSRKVQVVISQVSPD